MSPADLKARLARLRVPRRLLLGCCSGAAFVWIFAHYAPLPAEAFQYRDDAVITLSHARNLVDYGSIGVDPAGARVEGFSAPLQFWLFALAYAFTRCGYRAFLDLQVPVCTFLLGFGVVQLFHARKLLGLLLSAAIAFYLCSCLRFFGWHQSGMENAYTHALLVLSLASMVISLELRGALAWVFACALLAALTRVESILHVAPLLAIWAYAYQRAHRSYDALLTAAGVLGAWGLYQLLRYAYFGDFRPNTALAEGVDVGAFVRALATGDRGPRSAALKSIAQIAGEHRAYLALAALPLLMLGPRRASRSALVWMLVALCATGLVHPLLFGPARLDPVRTTSQVALVAPLLIATQWAELPGLPARLLALAGLAALSCLYFALEPPSDKFFCCPILRADPIADTCLSHARREALVAPSLANPDLGKISFRKQFLIFDLGLLGSPPLATFHKDHAATATYLLDYAAPDFIEMHGSWVCEYGYLQHDPRFAQRYRKLAAGDKLGLANGCASQGRSGIWFRRDMARDSGSAERHLLDDLTHKLDPQRVAQELARCRTQGGPLSCLYATRTVYRFIPELVRSGQLQRVIALFGSSPSARYDRSVLGARAHGLWYRDVVQFVRAH